MEKSTGSRASRKALTKPEKPTRDFPLTPHPSGRWVKRIRGVLHYFGQWARRENGKLVRLEGDGAQAALDEYNRVKDDLHAGRKPRPKDTDGLTIAMLCNHFLTAKLRKVEAEELTPRLFAEYKEVCELVVKQFGGSRLVDDLRPDDFAAFRAMMAKKWGPVRVGNSITRAKSVFKYGTDNGLIERTVRYGSEFTKPDKATLRKEKAKKPAKLFTAEELRAIIDGKDVHGEGENKPNTVKPDVTLRAMILLGINAGFGQTDCSALKLDRLDLAGSWVDFPRPKTGIPRRCWLWPETVEALKAAIAVRPEPAGHEESRHVFITTRGNAFVTHTPIQKGDDGKMKGGARKDLIGIQFTKLLKALGIRREGVNFYSLRHTLETIAGGSKDQVAVDLVMGEIDR